MSVTPPRHRRLEIRVEQHGARIDQLQTTAIGWTSPRCSSGDLA
jgi:hypothetical protein